MLIAHLSDAHLRPPGILYQGVVDSNATFVSAVQQINSLDPPPDLVLFSGDLVDEGTAEEYAFAASTLSTLKAPLLAIPGNHDEREAFRSALPGNGPIGPLHRVSTDAGPVRVIGLDVTVPGQHHGDMDEAAAEWLDAELAKEPQRPTIIMMHQPPFLSGIPFIDTYFCRQGERLAAVVSRYPCVERILCGHIHRLMFLRFADTVLCTAPSTATAIALRLADNAMPASFMEPPGFLLHHWREHTGLTTHFVPVGTFDGPFSFF